MYSVSIENYFSSKNKKQNIDIQDCTCKTYLICNGKHSICIEECGVTSLAPPEADYDYRKETQGGKPS